MRKGSLIACAALALLTIGAGIARHKIAAAIFGGEALFEKVMIEPDHRWFMVIGVSNDNPMLLIDDVETIRSYKDYVRVKTNSLESFFDAVSAGPHQNSHFLGAMLYRDGVPVDGEKVSTEGRFSFGPLAGKGFPVIQCRVTGAKDQLEPLLTERDASWLYPDGDVWGPGRDTSRWEFGFFIKTADRHRIEKWPVLYCK